MKSLYTQYETDTDLEKTGIELEYASDDPTKPTVIRISRAGGANVRFQKVMDIKTKPYRRQIQTETIDPSQLDTIMREVYAEAVVKGWENVTDREGVPIEFSKEACIKLFTDLPELFIDIQGQAQKVALFRKMVLEEDAKN